MAVGHGGLWQSIRMALLLLLLGQGSQVATAVAAEEASADKQKYAKVKTRQRQAVGQVCAAKLENIQALLQAESSPQPERLKQLVTTLRALPDSGCSSSSEKSQVYNLLGYSYYSLEQYALAIDSYLAMIAEPDVDERQKTATRYTVAQLYFMGEDYDQAARQLELWQAEATVVSGDGRVLLAQAYYQLNRKSESLKLVNAVVDETLTAGRLPKEGWWSLQRVLYYERQDYPRVVAILKQLLSHYPRPGYWQQLGGLYGQLERRGDQLAVTDLQRLQKQLSSERQWLSLAYLYLGEEVPFRAARVLEQGMAAGEVEASAKNLETLGSAWLQARETRRALPVLQRAANLSDSGAIAARLASAYLDVDDNSAAVREARSALRKGGLSRPGLTQLTLGAALVNLQCYRQAEPVFRQAAEDEKLRNSAEQWLRYVRGEGARREKLLESGADLAGCQLG
ncbi:tetratricopeptide repeat protein [Porticoccus sp.]